jgi:hypothetical protein
MKLPESLYFLRPGWWLVHVASVAAVFAAGFFASHLLAGHDDHSAHAEHGEGDHHDHTSSDALVPLMRQMLADSVQLQGALSEGDLARAATHAEAIAGACEDGEEEHGAVPERLGPSFLEHDRELHDSASRLAEALRGGERDDPHALTQQMVSACQSCHTQAPAAEGVDLSVLAAFAETSADPDAP